MKNFLDYIFWPYLQKLGHLDVSVFADLDDIIALCDFSFLKEPSNIFYYITDSRTYQ